MNWLAVMRRVFSRENVERVIDEAPRPPLALGVVPKLGEVDVGHADCGAVRIGAPVRLDPDGVARCNAERSD